MFITCVINVLHVVRLILECNPMVYIPVFLSLQCLGLIFL